jgi:hypothetical protein
VTRCADTPSPTTSGAVGPRLSEYEKHAVFRGLGHVLLVFCTRALGGTCRVAGPKRLDGRPDLSLSAFVDGPNRIYPAICCCRPVRTHAKFEWRLAASFK